jgi:hypothetical protein
MAAPAAAAASSAPPASAATTIRSKLATTALGLKTGLKTKGSAAVSAISAISNVKVSPNVAHIRGLGVTVIVIAIIMGVWAWTYGKKSSNDRTMQAYYAAEKKSLSSINDFDDRYGYLLRDYYIMTAYNCCCGGDYASDFVSTDALRCVISQGARVLDFEIYSVDGNPVVAASSRPEFSMKETYNFVPFVDAVDTINKYAFSSYRINDKTGIEEGCDNSNDPLFLCLRIKSRNVMIYEKIATILKDKLGSKLLDPRFSYSFNGEDLGKIKLTNFMSKVIIMIDETPGSDKVNTREIYKRTPLYEYVNMTFTMNSNKHTFTFINDNIKQDSKESAKKTIKYIVPERSTRSENLYASTTAHNEGCQMVAMAFQRQDANVKAYLKLFNSSGNAFILKPPELRYVPIVLKEPTAVNPTETLSSDKTAQTSVGTTITI